MGVSMEAMKSANAAKLLWKCMAIVRNSKESLQTKWMDKKQQKNSNA